MREVNALGNVRELSDDEVGRFVGGSDVAVVDLWAPWCGPCLTIAPVVEELAGELEGKVAFGKLNIDENPETPKQHTVMGIPTLLIYKSGELVDRVVGALPKTKLKEKLEQYL